MKGGKAGRKRRAGDGAAGRKAGGRGRPKTGGGKRPSSDAPKKGSRKKSFGASSTSEHTP